MSGELLEKIGERPVGTRPIALPTEKDERNSTEVSTKDIGKFMERKYAS